MRRKRNIYKKLINPHTFETEYKEVHNEWRYDLTKKDIDTIQTLIYIIESTASYDRDYKYLKPLRRILDNHYYETSDQSMLNDLRSRYLNQLKKLIQYA